MATISNDLCAAPIRTTDKERYNLTPFEPVECPAYILKFLFGINLHFSKSSWIFFIYVKFKADSKT